MPRLQVRDFGSCMSFSGSTKATITSTPVTITSGSSFTISVWINPANVNQEGMFYYNTSGGVGVGIGGPSGENAGNKLRAIFEGVAWLVTPYIFTPNTWYHIVMRRTGGVVTFFVNGVALAGTFSNTPTFSGTGAFIGGSSGGRQFNGLVDEVKVYNTGLSDSDCQALYYQGVSASSEGSSILKGYWKLDEGSGTAVNDSSGNANNGTSTATYSLAVPMRLRQSVRDFGTCGLLNGTDNFINLNNSTNFDANGSYITLEAWVYPTANQGANQGAILSKGGGSAAGGWAMYVNTNTQTVSVFFRSAGGSGVVGRTSNAALGINQWTHVAATIQLDTVTQGNNDIQIYINGIISQGSLTSTALPAVSTAKLKIGARAEDTAEIGFFTGLIDEVKIYSGQRTSTQIALDYTAFTSPTAGVLGYWKFDEGTATSLTDSSGNAITGTWQGTTTNIWSGNVVTRLRQAVRDFGTCYSFDGGSSKLAVPSQTFAGAFSLVGWLNASTLTNIRMIFGNSTLTNKLGFSGGKLFVRIIDGGSSDNTVFAPSTGSWHHLALVRNGSNVCTLYVDAIPNLLFSGVAQSGNSIWDRVGVDQISDFFGGFLDEIQWYSTALTLSQIQQLFYQGGTIGSATLAVYYKCDDNAAGGAATDSSGNSRTATATAITNSMNVVTRPRLLNRNFSSCLYFDGTNSQVTAGNTGMFNPATDAYSISFWFNTNFFSSASGNNRIFAYQTDANNGIIITLGGNTGTGVVTTTIKKGGVANGVGGLGIRVTPGTWYHVVATFDGVSTSTIYVNGSSQSGPAGGFGFPGVFNTVLISGINTVRFGGYLDEIQIYKTALTQSQIQQLYFQGGTISGASLCLYYNFDENTGTTATDTSGSGNNGTLGGGVLPTWSSNVVTTLRTAVS